MLLIYEYNIIEWRLFAAAFFDMFRDDAAAFDFRADTLTPLIVAIFVLFAADDYRFIIFTPVYFICRRYHFAMMLLPSSS